MQSVDAITVSDYLRRYFIYRTGVEPNNCVRDYFEQELVKAAGKSISFSRYCHLNKGKHLIIFSGLINNASLMENKWVCILLYINNIQYNKLFESFFALELSPFITTKYCHINCMLL